MNAFVCAENVLCFTCTNNPYYIIMLNVNDLMESGAGHAFVRSWIGVLEY